MRGLSVCKPVGMAALGVILTLAGAAHPASAGDNFAVQDASPAIQDVYDAMERAGEVFGTRIRSFAGAWLPRATYRPGTVVTFNGSSYLSLVKNTGVAPGTNTGDWALLDSPGPAGPPGPSGPAGPPGIAGPAGATGPAGPTGLSGPPGPIGAAGPRGPAGAAGPMGLIGPRGAAGPIGARGPTGARGPAGPTGPQGSQGIAGRSEAGDVPVILDATGRFMAYAGAIPVMQIGSDFVRVVGLPVGFDNFASSHFVFYHTQANCAGPRLMFSFDALQPDMSGFNDTGYYPGGPLTQQTVVSQENFLDGEDIAKPSAHCGAVNPPFLAPVWFGPVKTVDINSLGFVPPFSLQLE